jgi:hypothetical protein
MTISGWLNTMKFSIKNYFSSLSISFIIVSEIQSYLTVRLTHSIADFGGCAIYGVGLKLLDWWDHGFESL